MTDATPTTTTPPPRTGTGPLRALTLAFTVSSVGFAALTPFLVIWGRRDAHLGGAVVGLLFVAQAAGELSGGLAGGMLADRLGGRRILLLSTVGMAGSYGALTVVGAPAPAIALLFVGGLFEAAFHPTVFALLADLTPPQARTGAFGLLRAGSSLGTILGPLAGALIVSGGHLAAVFAFSAGVLLLAGAIVALALPQSPGGASEALREEAEELRDAVPGLRAILRDRALGLLVAGGGLLAITLTWWETDGLVILRGQRHFTPGTFALMLALAAGVTVLAQVPIARITGARSPRAMLATGALLQAAGLGTLALAASGLAWVAGGVVLVALGQMVWGPQLSALVSRIAPAGRGATYQAALSSSADIGQALGPLSGLALSGAVGAVSPWLLAVPLGMLGAFAGARAARRRPDGSPAAVRRR